MFRVLSYLHMSRGEYPPAEQAARVAVQLDGMNPSSYATLAQVYLTFNVQQMARQTLIVAQQHFPDDAALLVLAADLNFRLKRDAEGESMAVRALEFNPQDGYAQALLGTYYLRQKRYSRAVGFLASAVAAYPSRWDYLRDLGIALVHEREYHDACTWLVRAAQFNPQDALLQQYLYYALRFDESPEALLGKNSFFYYQHNGLGVLLNIIGWLAGVIGLCWLIAQWASRTTDGYSLLLGLFFLLGGLALLVISFPGLSMRGRKGEKFARRLNREIEKAQARWQMAADTEL